MNYSKSLSYLNSFLDFEKISLKSFPQWNLERMQFLLAAAGHPEKSYFPLLIAGTKGKGSTGFFLESILKASGVRAGFYSSPHLEDPRERIRLSGEMISKTDWAKGLTEIKQILAKCENPKAYAFTYFEIMTLLAALVFKHKKIQVGIFEVGMGGRWDATNAIDHKLAILTPIHLDHEAFLGNTISKIAREKAAIIRSQSHVVVSPQVREAMKVIKGRGREQGARIYEVRSGELKAGLRGDYQKVNAAAAKKAAELLRDEFGFRVTSGGIRQGVHAKGWAGRFEVLYKGSREWVLDAAHNPISIEALVRNLKAGYASRPRTLVFGTSRDKNSAAMLRLLSGYFEEIILTQAQNSRSAEVGTLLVQARGHFQRIYPFRKVSEALSFAKESTRSGNLIVVTGSFYVVGEARRNQKLK